MSFPNKETIKPNFENGIIEKVKEAFLKYQNRKNDGESLENFVEYVMKVNMEVMSKGYRPGEKYLGLKQEEIGEMRRMLVELGGFRYLAAYAGLFHLNMPRRSFGECLDVCKAERRFYVKRLEELKYNLTHKKNATKKHREIWERDRKMTELFVEHNNNIITPQKRMLYTALKMYCFFPFIKKEQSDEMNLVLFEYYNEPSITISVYDFGSIVMKDGISKLIKKLEKNGEWRGLEGIKEEDESEGEPKSTKAKVTRSSTKTKRTRSSSASTSSVTNSLGSPHKKAKKSKNKTKSPSSSSSKIITLMKKSPIITKDDSDAVSLSDILDSIEDKSVNNERKENGSKVDAFSEDQQVNTKNVTTLDESETESEDYGPSGAILNIEYSSSKELPTVNSQPKQLSYSSVAKMNVKEVMDTMKEYMNLSDNKARRFSKLNINGSLLLTLEPKEMMHLLELNLEEIRRLGKFIEDLKSKKFT